MVTVLGHRSHTRSDPHAVPCRRPVEPVPVPKDPHGQLISHRRSARPPALPQRRCTAAKSREYKTHIDKWKHELAEEEAKAHEYEQKVEHAEKPGRPLRSRRSPPPDRRRPLFRHPLHPQPQLLLLRPRPRRRRPHHRRLRIAPPIMYQFHVTNQSIATSTKASQSHPDPPSHSQSTAPPAPPAAAP